MSALGKIAERSEKAVESLRVRERLATPEAQEAPARKALPELSKEMDTLVQKLNVAARDIVEAVDGSLPRDFEKKFANGERDIYTRRILEGLGKRTERTIAERYGNDRMMRTRVDSYIRLFERLLDTMNAAPGGEGLVEACLASESGRIYVMLAETAGRIPPQK